MIRINLQKNTTAQKKRSKTGKRWVFPFLGTTLMIGMAASAYFLILDRSTEESQQQLPVLSTDIKPSTHYRPDMIEDVVTDITDSSSEKKLLVIPYSEMSASEKISYEILFAKNVVELLNRTMGSGIRLTTLETEDFTTIRAHGLSSSRGDVSSMFSLLRKNGAELLPRPHSAISEVPGEGYRFVFTCTKEFGLEHSDPFEVLDNLPFREAVPGLVRQFSSLASANSVNLSHAPRQISSDKTGNYRRILYRVEGESSYRDFVRFILSLHKENIPCAFRNINLRARSGGNIRLELELLFIVRE
ncbi:hypothetical protein CHISP_0866 [Chitinispirillum alkaliphilum]|nr:hypothetical protein CHISP_0866 [Chitinispirillum alkaliphilum]